MPSVPAFLSEIPCHRLAQAACHSLLAGLVLAGGCRASSLPPAAPGPAAIVAPSAIQAPPIAADPPAPSSSLHWPVPPPAEIQAADPVLWVALAARLGPAAGSDGANDSPLRLQAAGGMLTLIDGRGQRFMAPQLLLHWRHRPLPAPLSIQRRVVGPLPSYESAERVARGWRSQGAVVEIAKPGDWELWAPADAPDPAGQSVRSVSRTETSQLVLELHRSQGSVELQGPLRLEAPQGLQWQGGTYTGPFLLQADAHGTWSLVEQVPLERYLEGVVPHEIGGGSPAAALAAQAVLARTWAVRNRHRFAVDGYHLCADTQCQVYSDPRQADAEVRLAIASSRGQVLAAAGQPIHAVYHASNGGVAAGFEEVWQGDAVPYLKAFADGPAAFSARFPLPLAPARLAALLDDGGQAWGADHPSFRWHRRITAAQLQAALGEGATSVALPSRLKVLERGASGRVLALEVAGASGRRVLRLDAIRRTLRQLPSTLFRVSPAGPGAWLVDGAGFGHGAGLSQAGAIDQARRGWGRDQILQHYYPGTQLVPLEALGDAL
ncbi:MAG: SpoIID/LytB domain-containing protein [Synechococcaceae cyanobacterium ELA263]